MQKGTEHLVVLKTVTAVVSEIISFFSLYYSIKNQIWILPVFALAAPVAGAAVWNYLCKVNGWPFYLGGPQNEPYGIYAFIWGIVTLLPVVFSARLLTTQHALNNIAAIGQWFVSWDCLFVLIYVIFAGICALFFYGGKREFGVRALVSSFDMSHERTEQIMIVLWGLAISVFPTFTLSLAGGTHAPKSGTWEILLFALPAAIAVIFCLMFLSFFYLL